MISVCSSCFSLGLLMRAELLPFDQTVRWRKPVLLPFGEVEASLPFHVQPRVSCGCRSSSSLCQTLATPVPTDRSRRRRWMNGQPVAGSQGKARQGGPSSCIVGGNTGRELTRHGLLLIRGMYRTDSDPLVAGAVCSTSVCQEEHGRCFRFADWGWSAAVPSYG